MTSVVVVQLYRLVHDGVAYPAGSPPCPTTSHSAGWRRAGWSWHRQSTA